MACPIASIFFLIAWIFRESSAALALVVCRIFLFQTIAFSLIMNNLSGIRRSRKWPHLDSRLIEDFFAGRRPLCSFVQIRRPRQSHSSRQTTLRRRFCPRPSSRSNGPRPSRSAAMFQVANLLMRNFPRKHQGYDVPCVIRTMVGQAGRQFGDRP